MDSVILFGYKNVFLNKNKSIGVKWSAIDGGKRNEIEKILNLFGFSRYTRSEMDLFINRLEYTTENVSKLKMLLDNIDTSLFYGGVYMWKYNIYGRDYVSLELHVNSIFQANIKPFLDGMGYTEDIIKIEIEKRENAIKLRKMDIEKRNREDEEKLRITNLLINQILEKNHHLIEPLLKYPKGNFRNTPGIYVKPFVTLENEKISFKAYAVTLPKRAKIHVVSNDYFDKLDDALNYELSAMHRKFQGTIKDVYKVK